MRTFSVVLCALLVASAMSVACVDKADVSAVACTAGAALAYTCTVTVGTVKTWGMVHCKFQLDSVTTKPTATTLLAAAGVAVTNAVSTSIKGTGSAAGSGKMYCVGNKAADVMITATAITLVAAVTPATPATSVKLSANPTVSQSATKYQTVTVSTAFPNSNGNVVCAWGAAVMTLTALRAATTNNMKTTIAAKTSAKMVFDKVTITTEQVVSCAGDGDAAVKSVKVTVAAFAQTTIVAVPTTVTGSVSALTYGTVTATVVFPKTLGGSFTCALTAAAETTWTKINGGTTKQKFTIATTDMFTTSGTVTFAGVAAGAYYASCAGDTKAGKASAKLTVPTVDTTLTVNGVDVSFLTDKCVSKVIKSVRDAAKSVVTVTSSTWANGKATCALIKGTAVSTKTKIDAVNAEATKTMTMAIKKKVMSAAGVVFCPATAATDYTIQCYGDATANVVKASGAFYQEAALACPAKVSASYSLLPSMAVVFAAVFAVFQL